MNFLEEAFLKVFKARSVLTGSQWADRYRYVAPGTSPEPGEWRTDRVPYLREPLDSATDKKTEYVVMCCSSQIGKSELLLNVLGYFADQDPAPQLMLQPTVEAAEAFSKERIDPTFRYSEGLQNKLEEGKDGRGSSRKSSTTIRMKHYNGGYLALVGANSPAGLASRPIRVLLCDEIDRYSPTKEGDPLKLAIQRTTNFHNRKVVLVSTPTIKDGSYIESWWLKSDQRFYYVPCPHCGAMHVLDWDVVKWDKDQEGNHLPMTARIVCPKCGKVERGAYKPNIEQLKAGVWKASKPESSIKGYHINSLYSPWVNLYSLVEEWIQATKGRDKKGLMEFINLKLGQVWEDQAIGSDEWEYLHRRREYYPSEGLPNGVLLLTAGVDVQRDRLECSVYGWGVGKECWGIEHRIIEGRPDDPVTWQQLDGLLQKKRTRVDGVNLAIACACVDSGDGQYTADVYRYTKPRERFRIFSIKGRGGVGVPFINSPTKSNVAGAKLFTLGVDAGKSAVMGRLKVEDEGPNYVHFDRRKEAGFTEEFFQQLLSEVFEQKFEKGSVKSGWKKLRERNEALDCCVYATAALEIMQPNFEFLAEYYANGGHVRAQAAKPKRRGVISRGVTI